MKGKVPKTHKEWRQRLMPEQYAVARQKGREHPFTGKYHDSKERGTYKCATGGNELFISDAKFDSGWTSFTAPTEEENVRIELDTSHRMLRTELLCAAGDAHLGYVFNDASRLTNLRCCINSVVLDLDKEE